jgi:hypothetical protein
MLVEGELRATCTAAITRGSGVPVVTDRCCVCVQKERTALHYAVESGNQKLAEMLLNTGADVNVQDKVPFSRDVAAMTLDVASQPDAIINADV